MPYHGEAVKEAFEQLKRVEPDLVLTHTRDDLHQDHRLACELTWNTFRDHLILEYEVPKWDGDLGQPQPLRPARGPRRRAQARPCRPPFPDPGSEALVRRGDVPRADASARPRVCLPVPLRGGFLRPEGGGVVVTGLGGPCASSSPEPRLHRLGTRARARGRGHDVTGLDTLFYRGCDFGAEPAEIAGVRLDVRDVTATISRVRRGRSPRRPFERPARRPRRAS